MDDHLPLTSTHWGTYRVETDEGRVTALKPFEEDDDPSPIGPGIVSALHHPTRITGPMIRESWLADGPDARTDLRGKEGYVAVSWERLEGLLADEITRVRRDHGDSAIYAGSYGWGSAGRFHHPQSQLKRFLNLGGGFTSSFGTYSFAAAEAVVPHILGDYREHMNRTTSWRSIAEAGELFVAFGGVPVKNGQIEAGGAGRHVQKEGLRAAASAGVEFVNISPIRSDMMDDVGADWWPARPNTDVAIMLGMAHVIYTEGLHDQDFMDRYCHGFDRFIPYLTGEGDGVAKTPEWASEISEIPAEDIRALARKMAAKRTVVAVSWSLTRQSHGEQPYWAAIMLASMIGVIGLPGGGVGFGYSAENSIGDDAPLTPGASFPTGRNPVPDFIPVARISELLETPGGTFEFNGERRTFPDIRFVWWAGGNPYHHHQDLNRLAKAWEKPETIVVNDWCWNAAAKRADIVIPCPTHVERDDIAIAVRDPYLVKMTKAANPPGDVRSEYATFSALAHRLGYGEAFTEGRTEDEWIRWIYDVTRQRMSSEGMECPPWDEFLEVGWWKTPRQEKATVMMEAFRADPKENRLWTSSGKIEVYSERVAAFGYDDAPGHPVWREPVEWLGNAAEGELHLISNQPERKLHSQLDQGDWCAGGKLHGREPVAIHPDDAAARGIADGDLVRLFNDRGACLGAALVTDDLRRGVIRMSTGAWWDPDETGMCRHGNPNAVTRDVGTSRLGQGPTAHSCLVRLEKYEGEAPPVRAFEPPEVRKQA